jgi:hypothetical protein
MASMNAERWYRERQRYDGCQERSEQFVAEHGESHTTSFSKITQPALIGSTFTTTTIAIMFWFLQIA